MSRNELELGTIMVLTLGLLLFVVLLAASSRATYRLIEDDFWTLRRPIILGRDRVEEASPVTPATLLR